MQKALGAKIESAPRIWILVGIVAIVFAVIAVLPKKDTATNLIVDNQNFQLQVANTPAEQEQGLSGLKSLPQNQGMLFKLQSQQVTCVWMKGMEFPLDILWLNSDKKVVHIQAEVSPATYPHKFCPLTPAQYTLELNAGQIYKTGIRLGQTLQF
jgi:uncharacterized membrane protein (UPF0127 family)